MRTNDPQKASNASHRLWIISILCMAVLLAACANSAAPVTSYTPNPDEVDLAQWEADYPLQYKDWAGSVHGQAYLSGDTNAATCNDCHAAPVEGEAIKSAAFHLESPAHCARCHADETLMADYDIATDVYETYLSDFHGTTIHYYAQEDLTAIRDEAVCSDCHGAHAIYPQDDDRSSVHEANLQATCANCHANAPEAFTSAYGHYRPVQSPASSTSDSTVVFIVKVIYQAMIPVVLGGMLIYIALDIFFRIKRKKAVKAIAADQASAPDDTHPENEA